MKKNCLACGSSRFETFDLVDLVYSRSNKKYHKWLKCLGCGSIMRLEKASDNINLYQENKHYINAEYVKRIKHIHHITKYLDKNDVIFDIGSGPGVVSKILVDLGYHVVQVEPFRNSSFDDIEQLKIDIKDFLENKYWNRFLKKNQKAVFILVDVLEHLDIRINVLKKLTDENVKGMYLETGCVDFAWPNINRWYYLDYPDHIFVPSSKGLSRAFGASVKLERVSNSLHSYDCSSLVLRNLINKVNALFFALFHRELILTPTVSMRDHVSMFIEYK